jgi:hypothetical protein
MPDYQDPFDRYAGLVALILQTAMDAGMTFRDAESVFEKLTAFANGLGDADLERGWERLADFLVRYLQDSGYGKPRSTSDSRRLSDHLDNQGACQHPQTGEQGLRPAVSTEHRQPPDKPSLGHDLRVLYTGRPC